MTLENSPFEDVFPIENGYGYIKVIEAILEPTCQMSQLELHVVFLYVVFFSYQTLGLLLSMIYSIYSRLLLYYIT